MAAFQMNMQLLEAQMMVNHFCRMSSQIAALSLEIDNTNNCLMQAITNDLFKKACDHHSQLTVLESVKRSYEKFAEYLSNSVIQFTTVYNADEGAKMNAEEMNAHEDYHDMPSLCSSSDSDLPSLYSSRSNSSIDSDDDYYLATSGYESQTESSSASVLGERCLSVYGYYSVCGG